MRGMAIAVNPAVPSSTPASAAEPACAPALLDHAFEPAATAQMERLVADFGRMYRERNEALAEVASAHRDALLRLSRAAEYRDDDTGVHIVRMGFLAGALPQLPRFVPGR